MTSSSTLPSLHSACADAWRVLGPLLERPGEGAVVAFDADGTLWRGDVGEDLLRYLATHELLPRHRGRAGLYAEYERRVAIDPADAYAYSVAVMADMEEGTLEAVCRDFFRARFAGRLFPWVGRLLEALGERGYVPWIVSASPWWPVVAGGEALGVPRERVIGVQCEIEAGRLTDRIRSPVPCGEGKVAQLRARGVRPVLALGNGELDLPMLAWAGQAVVVAPPGEDTALVRAGGGRGWPVLRC